MTVPRVKICGLTRRVDAEAAAEAGASYFGAVFAEVSPRRIRPEQAAELFEGLAPRRVGVFVNASLEELVASAGAASLDVLQLHGDEPPARVDELRARGPWEVWKAVRVRDAHDLLDALDRYGELVDGILLDAWSSRAHGGTGRSFGWEEVAAVRNAVPSRISLIVAGGLRPENVGSAVALLRPDAVDISSGVESAPGIKDAAAITALLASLRSRT